MFSQIVSSCSATFALTNREYNHAKAISSIRDKLKNFGLKKQIASWPEDLEWIVTEDCKPTQSKTLPPMVPERSQIAFLQYTSGSTSAPKGVMITHGNLAHNLTIITDDLKAVDDTVVVSWLPQYHDMGLIGSYLGAIYCGGCGYYMSPLSFLQRPMLWIEAVSKYRATHLQAPNFAFKLTSRKFTSDSKDLKLDSVRHIINAAEPVDEASIKSFYDTFSPFGLSTLLRTQAWGHLFENARGKRRLGCRSQKDRNESLQHHGTDVVQARCVMGWVALFDWQEQGSCLQAFVHDAN